MPEQHVFERRVSALANSIKEQREQLRRYIAPPGKRVPFTTQMNEPDALQWWKAHINDDYGKAAMAGMSPLDMIKLQQKLRGMEDINLA